MPRLTALRHHVQPPPPAHAMLPACLPARLPPAAGTQTISGVRLANATGAHATQGRLEVYVTGQGWSTVGTLEGWLEREMSGYLPTGATAVACRQLGFQPRQLDWKFSTTWSTRKDYPSGGLPVPQLVSSIACTGSEASLSECELRHAAPADTCRGANTVDCAYSLLNCGGGVTPPYYGA